MYNNITQGLDMGQFTRKVTFLLNPLVFVPLGEKRKLLVLGRGLRLRKNAVPVPPA